MSPEDEAAFRDFAAAARPRLVRTAYLLCGDPHEAHDLAQVTLMRVHRRWRSIERTDLPQAYARKVLINLAASFWRRRLRAPLVALTAVGEPAGADPADAYGDRAELWDAVRSLPPRTRAILVLRYWEDLSEADTAAALGCSVGSVKSQASRGLERLRAVLEEQRNDDGTWAAAAEVVS
ncbi:MAG: SigE family RNA polymerase sigma factor [Frankiaceae bacterium]|nr:SigE family RNA polymerase sigma factor [Frankiaceae bacterium]